AELEITGGACARDAQACQTWIIAERHLPFDRAFVQVVRRQRRVRWPDNVRVQTVAVHRVALDWRLDAFRICLRSEPASPTADASRSHNRWPRLDNRAPRERDGRRRRSTSSAAASG